MTGVQTCALPIYHQTFNKKSYGFLLYFTFQGLLPPLLSAFIPYYTELLSILLQNYNPVATKTDIGGEKMKKEDQTTVEIQYTYCMKFFERLKKNRYINKNTDAFLYVNLPHTGGWRAHNSWWTSAQQLICKRTTAVVRFTIVYYTTTDTIPSNNLSYISQQLIPVLSIPMSMGTDDFSYSLRGNRWQ